MSSLLKRFLPSRRTENALPRAAAAMDHLSSPKLPLNEQDNCDLFEKLPGEVRDRIYTFALSCFDDPDELYERDTPYWRPNCLAPPKVDCALLQTCQRIYNEAWFRPWASATQKLWLTHPRRRPDDTKILTTSKLQVQLNRVFGSRGRVETNGVQVFPQLYMLEQGSALSDILHLDRLYPYTFTITIRHHDWWYWEYDNRLRIGAKWVNECRFPDSVRVINLELESLQRKSNQIDFIAEMMQNTWYFQRNDGTIFSAAKDDVTTSVWTGSSTWENQRWIRDETRADQVDYYIKTVSWKPDREMTTIERSAPDLLIPDRFPVIEDASAYLYTWQLSSAGVPPGTGASESKQMVLHFIQNGINTGFTHYFPGLDPGQNAPQQGTALANPVALVNAHANTAVEDEATDSPVSNLDSNSMMMPDSPVSDLDAGGLGISSSPHEGHDWHSEGARRGQ